MKDKLAKLDIEKGCQEADGATALGYARSRHTSGIGDIDRVKHQREVVAAVGDKVLSPWTFINPVRYWNLTWRCPTSSPSARAPVPLQRRQVGLGDDERATSAASSRSPTSR